MSTTDGSIEPSASVATTAGVKVTCVTRCSARKPVRSVPNLRSSGMTTSVAPVSRVMNHSQPNMSKLAEANWPTRWPGPTPITREGPSTKLARPAWETSTPFGRPVDPDV